MRTRRWLTVPAAAVALGSGLLVTACGGGSPDTASSATLQDEAPNAVDPARFTTVVDNPFLPLAPGTRMTYEGRSGEGLERIVVEVTRDTRTVMGVTCLVVRDTVTVGGNVVEDTYDWYAQDGDGNVWYFGEATTAYEKGKPQSTEGSWEAGVDGARPGIVMKAQPAVGESYRQEYYRGHAEDRADVLSLTATASVPYGTFRDMVMTRDYTPLEPDLVEHKYYARGVGFVLEEEVEGGDTRLELVKVERA
jgi:hypothetical protein